jgi:nucleotide-binding universal stress UspA family protein
MAQIRKIMVALAFSEHAKGIYNFAAQQAGFFGAELLVASVINSRDVEAIDKIAALGYDMDPRQYIGNIKSDRRKFLDEIVAACPYDVGKVVSTFKVGHPVEVLLHLIVKENIDLVIMGIRGRTELEHLLIGSVAEKMFRKSPVTVISYREGKEAQSLRNRLHS